MVGSKPFLAKFSRKPRERATPEPSHAYDAEAVTPQPRPTILTEVRNETTDDN